MAFGLLIIGLILVITGVRDTYTQLGQQLLKDFTGSQSFLPWAGAIFLVGLAGYVPQLRSLSHWFLALILVSIFLSKQGFIAKFTQAFQNLPAAPLSGTQSSAAQSATSSSLAHAQSLLTPQNLASLGSNMQTFAALAGA